MFVVAIFLAPSRPVAPFVLCTLTISDTLTSVKGFVAEYERIAYTRGMVILSGDEVRRRREALGLSQAGLAAWAGVHVRTVSKWERGIHKPPEMLAVAFRLWEERPETFDPHAMERRRPATGGAGRE